VRQRALHPVAAQLADDAHLIEELESGGLIAGGRSVSWFAVCHEWILQRQRNQFKFK
jgi:hypothetical protein